MDRDRNLLFGVLAVQLRKVTPSQIMAAAGAWAADPSKDLPERLAEDGALSKQDLHLLDQLVNEAVRVHDGDATAAMQSFGGEEQVYQSFRGSIVLSESDGVASVAPTALGSPADPDSVAGVQESPGRYTHVSEYGRGGMGRVLLVEDQHLGREIALKELLPGLGSSGDGEGDSPVRLTMPVVARFLQEARITGQLEHPSIVPVYELGHRKDGTLYYTMKLVRGKTLSDAIQAAPSLRDRLSLLSHFVDLCQAIAYAHSRRVIHRDLKPANVMVGEFGETVVLDWGLSKAGDKEDAHADGLAKTLQAMNLGDQAAVARTQYGQALGTPVYMPPEQALGRLELVDERSDVYSLGAVLYELLTGTVPFDGKSLQEIVRQVTTEQPKPLQEIEGSIPSELVAICERAMHKDPGKRYQSARELAEEVQRFQAGALVQTYEYKFSEHLRRWAKRHSMVLGTAAAAIVVLLGIGFYAFLSVSQAREQERNQRISAEEARAAEEVARKAAEKAQIEAQASRKEARQRLYNSSILLAARHIEEGGTDLANDLLWEAPVEYRGWEWGYYLAEANKGLVTLRGYSPIVSPDGERIVTTSSDNMMKVWETQTGSEVATLAGYEEAVELVDFSPGGEFIATTSIEGTVKVWDVETGMELHTLVEHAGLGTTATFSPDGTRIVTTSSQESAVIVWDTLTGHQTFSLVGHTKDVYSTSFTQDGSQIFTTSNDGAVKVWDALTGKELYTLSEHSDWVSWVDLSPDGRRIVSVSENGIAKVWNALTGMKIFALVGHGHKFESAHFSPDGMRILTTSDNETAKLWDAQSGNEILTLAGHSDWISSASFSSDGRRILTTSNDKTAKVWNTETGNEVLTLVGHSDRITVADFSPDCRRIVTNSEDGTAKLWDAQAGDEVATFFGRLDHLNPDGTQMILDSGRGKVSIWSAHIDKGFYRLAGLTGPASTANLSPDGSRIVTVARDDVTRTRHGSTTSGRGEDRGTAEVWDTETGDEILTLAGHGSVVLSAQFSPDGKRIVTASRDHTAKVWDALTGKEIVTLSGHSNTVRSATFSPDGERIITRSDDDTAKVWDAESGNEIATLVGHSDTVDLAMFSPNAKRVVTTSEDGTAKVWDSESGNEIHTLLEPLVGSGARKIGSVFFSPDGGGIATVSVDGIRQEEEDGSTTYYPAESTTRVWDARTGNEIFTLVGHFGSGNSSTFSPDGSRIGGPSHDSTAKVWDAESGDEIIMLVGHTGFVGSVTYSPDGTRIVTTSEDDTVRIWNAETGAELATLSWGAEDLADIAIFSRNKVLITPDGRSIISISIDGTVKTWRSAPWRIEDLRAETPSVAEPEGGWATLDEEWQARFKVWKRQR